MANIQIVTEDTFEAEVLNSPVPVLVDFMATWCGPCKQLAPLLEKIAQGFDGEVKVVKVDIDDSPGLRAKYSIKSIPNVIVFVGGKQVAQQVGLKPLTNLLHLLNLEDDV